MFFKRFALAITLCSAAAGLTMLAAPSALADGGPFGARQDSFRIRARMRAAGHIEEGKADYRERVSPAGLEQRFSVQVQNFAPNTEVQVVLEGQPLLVIMTDAFGRGEVEFRTFTPDDNPGDGDPPIPQDFPHLTAGMVISAGPVSGAFQ